MNIKISNVDVAYVKEIDKKAEDLSKKLGRRVSRNEYIKMLIQHDCELKLMKLKEDKFDQAVENVHVSNERMIKMMQEMIDSNNRLFHLMASGIDITEGVYDD